MVEFSDGAVEATGSLADPHGLEPGRAVFVRPGCALLIKYGDSDMATTSAARPSTPTTNARRAKADCSWGPRGVCQGLRAGALSRNRLGRFRLKDRGDSDPDSIALAANRDP
jgi:hypothetical protein